MPRKKGTPKSGGRQAGTPNKITTELRDRIKLFLENNFELIEEDFQKLTPDRRIVIFERYLKFVLPLLGSITIGLNIEKMSDEELSVVINKMTKDGKES